jgi:hypothetical protein
VYLERTKSLKSTVTRFPLFILDKNFYFINLSKHLYIVLCLLKTDISDAISIPSIHLVNVVKLLLEHFITNELRNIPTI